VTIGATKRLGQFNGFVEHDTPRHIQAVLELVDTQPHHRALDGREVTQGPIDEWGDERIERIALTGTAVQNGAVVGQIGFLKTHEILGKEVNVKGIVVRDDELVERLQGEFT
jgi:hypothetical protein